jgi:hypothetical protein
MAKVYSLRRGVSLVVGSFGVASNDEPCVVPADVAMEMEALVEDGAPVYRAEYLPGEREAEQAYQDAAQAVATPPAGNVDETSDVPGGAYYAAGGKVHHTRRDCIKGNDIEQPIPGTGELPLCPKCKKLAGASEQE